MHISRIHLRDFKRFTALTVDLSEPSRLVMLCGPNGSGKSSVFEALKSWQSLEGPTSGLRRDAEYQLKGGNNDHGPDVGQRIDVAFHEGAPQPAAIAQAMYFRTAYRNEPAFSTNQLVRAGDVLAGPQPERMIDNDSRVSDNYQRLAGQAFDGLFRDVDDSTLAIELRDRLIGRLGTALLTVLPDLHLEGMADPLGGGTFRFAKGTTADFPYMNLSGGEKAVFDLLLDLAVKTPSFTSAVICIDEPEAHTNPVIQGTLLDALLDLAGGDSQLWLATHSVGMLRRARELSDASPGSVAFLDFGERDFDEPQELAPVSLSRAFWKRTIATSLGDVADLVAPSTLVLCEGQPSPGNRSEFDVRCLRAVFESHMPDVDFIPIGGDTQVIDDQYGVGRAVQTMTPGTTVIWLVDHDDRSAGEAEELGAKGVRTLGRRNLEGYLLDDEVLEALCASLGESNKWLEIQAAREKAHQSAIDGGKPADDWKATKGDIYNACKKILQLTQAGSTADVFLAEQSAPLIKPGMATYDELRKDVFG